MIDRATGQPVADYNKVLPSPQTSGIDPKTVKPHTVPKGEIIDRYGSPHGIQLVQCAPTVGHIPDQREDCLLGQKIGLIKSTRY